MEITYIAFIYKENEFNGYVVVFPDIEYGVTQGEDFNDALYMAKDYLETHFKDIEFKDLPKPMCIKEAYKKLEKEPNNGTFIQAVSITINI